MIQADFDYVRQFVRDQSAIVLEPGKEYLVEARLQTLVRKNNLPSIDKLVATLRTNPRHSLHRDVLDAVTTNETSFFRDEHPFDALRQHILPDLLKSRGTDRQINIWCGASSTGQEPFSVMMTIAEHFPQLLGWKLNYLATDLCRDALERAKVGRFTPLEVSRGLPPAMKTKYFTDRGGGWEFRDDLRRRVDFREMNLVGSWCSMPSLDLVFLRNVLIYFEPKTKEAILAKVRKAVRPGGYLLVGGAETVPPLEPGFERIVLGRTICYRPKSS